MTTKQFEGLQQLNQLKLTEKEQADMLNIFEKMNENEKVLDQFNTDNTEIMVHVMPMTNVLREDKREQPFAREDLLAGAPERSEDSWQVPRLVK